MGCRGDKDKAHDDPRVAVLALRPNDDDDDGVTWTVLLFTWTVLPFTWTALLFIWTKEKKEIFFSSSSFVVSFSFSFSCSSSSRISSWRNRAAAAAYDDDDDATKEVKEEEKEQAFSFTSFFVSSFASSQVRLSSHPARHRGGKSGEVDDDDMDGYRLQWGKCSSVLLHNLLYYI